MANQILYSTAVDPSGNLVHVKDAVKGVDYFCPVCNRRFILRKSGKSGPGSRRPHFAHNEVTPNCTPEGVLHLSFKKYLVELIERRRADKNGLSLSWTCESCGFQNTGNLLEKVCSVEEEYALDGCRPDIALLDDQQRVVAVIEIVVTHSPDEYALRYYRDRHIVLIEINVSSEEELLRVEERVMRPDAVDFCMNPNCQNSDRHPIDRKVIVRASRCGRCFSKTETYRVVVDGVFGKHESRGFTDGEIDLVKNRHRNIRIVFDQATKGKYPVYDCLNCRRFQSRYRRRRF